MATKTIEILPLEQCKNCISSKENFVLQGGAGSGKTETLKELLLYVKHTLPESRVMCITHTNVAVDEIKSRVGNIYTISTIHSYLNGLIKDYKKNIKSVISALFVLQEMSRNEYEIGTSESDYKKAEHEKYKKVYGKYADKLYDLKNEAIPKVTGKREYDKDPVRFNEELNMQIKKLNREIVDYVDECDYSNIRYNDTKFNSYSNITYGHDGLLELFHLLFEKYPVLGKMIVDRYDYVFIDEYQDTNSDVISDFISISTEHKLTVGLFGDSMQAIYSDGIGDVKSFIDKGDLQDIPKLDNFRCSHEVISFINPLRLDNIEQSVAFKMLATGEFETAADRRGKASALYSICESKPTAFSSAEEKQQYQTYIDELIEEAQRQVGDCKVLLLTNKSISQKNGFQYLYKVFDDRYLDVKDRIETYLKAIQVLDVGEICKLYEAKKFNELVSHIRHGGFVIQKAEDKITLKKHVDYLLNTSDLSLWQAVEYAQTAKLIKPSEACNNIIKRNKVFVEELKNDKLYQQFKKLYAAGLNTYNRINGDMKLKSEEEFDHYQSLLKKETFIERLFSVNAKFLEVMNYIKYLNEETQFITMHKTKGSSIPSVVVVMEEFYWNEYDFSSLYTTYDKSKEQRHLNSQKLIYVACSRARNSVVCVKVIKPTEVTDFLKAFPMARCLEDYSK
ncbi:MAG: UvrD-helicase domain-containing protein [Eubacteriales bacterium]